MIPGSDSVESSSGFFNDATTKDALVSTGADALNNGIWHFDDDYTAPLAYSDRPDLTKGLLDHFTGQTLNYTPWTSRLDFFSKSAAAVTAPHYVAAEVDFKDKDGHPVLHSVDTIVAVVPQSNGIRNYSLEYSEDGAEWTSVKYVEGNISEWVLTAHFDAVQAQAIRIVVYDVNNGIWYEDKQPLPQVGPNPFHYGTSLHATIYEIEAYGH